MSETVRDLALAERLEHLNAVARDARSPNVHPRDAATLILLDPGANGDWRVLMGRRHARHSFVPGAWVFPGGGVERGDSRVALTASLADADAARLAAEVPARSAARLPRALAVAALRETLEEIGLAVDLARDPNGRIAAADLSRLRFIARAITPPRRPKRFDARFFARLLAPAEVNASSALALSGELEDVAWVSLADALNLELAAITVAILDELATRLATDPTLSTDADVPFYQWRNGGFRRTLIAAGAIGR